MTGSTYQRLSEVQRILTQDSRTKDVFRELDGFLVLMSVLSTVQEQPTTGASTKTIVPPSPVTALPDEAGEEDPGFVNVMESTRLAFEILSEAIYRHPQNAEWFRVGR